MRLIASLAAVAALAGCGFSPMYGPDATRGGPVIGPVAVATIEGKSGHELKVALDRLFGVERGAAAPQRLEIKLEEFYGGLGYRVDDTASRADMILRANYVLFDAVGKEAVKGYIESVASYDIPASAYGEIAAQNAARERAANVLAERIRNELALKLQRARAERAAAAEQKTQ
jgi:LPS-assembly lipoprotein